MAAIYLFMWVAFVWGCCSGREYGDNNRCPSACSCLGDYIDCSSMGLIEVPRDLPDWVTDLEIQSNAISTLHNDDFNGLLRLKIIDLSNNEISVVNETVFTEIPALVKLAMNRNKLREVPRLRGNPLLKELELTHNDIDTIHAAALSSLRQLDTLDLSYNNLMDIPTGTFPAGLAITKLFLRNNGIFRLAPGCFDNLTSLESLKLNKNAIEYIDKNLFTNLTSLRSLDLSRNKLVSMAGLTFSKLKNLQVLKLRRNNIRVLSDGVFYGLARIQTLLLDENNLVAVTRVWLYGLENLTHLSLSHNKISVIESNVWECAPKLESLDLSNNNLKVIGTTTFSHLTSLTTLVLANNQVEVIQDDAFKAVQALKELDLNNNTISWTIEDTLGVFRNLSNLKRLSLMSNKITTLTKRAFTGLASLEELDLLNNNITMVQGKAFEPMPELRVLKFNTSSLFCDCQLSWLPMWLRDNNFEHSVTVKCHHPENLRGQSIFVIDSNHFKCDGHFPKPMIFREPRSQKVLKGENVTLNCSAASTETQGSPTQFQWKKDNELLDSTRAETENYANRHDNLTHYTSTLRIGSAEDDDAGKYQCIISNDFGSAYSKRATIGVYVFPVFTKTPVNVTAKATTKALLVCAAMGEPKPDISWQKDGGYDSFPAAQERRMLIIPADDHFYIVNVKAADEGVYSCIAKNEAGTIMANVTLTVLQKPAFVKPMEAKYSEVGSTTVLECLAAGSPRPRLTWRLNGQPLVLTQRHFFTAENQLLVIVETEARDAGDYTCEMSNTLGTIKDTSQLTVMGEGDWEGGGGGGGGLDDASTTTGIIIIAVVCCVVGTSLVWVIIIYQTRKRQEMYSATPTDETTLPGEGYLVTDQDGGYVTGGPPLTSTAFQYQLDLQMKESGYESSSGRYREARTAAIFPSEADSDGPRPPSYAMLRADGRYIEQSDENSVSSSHVYPRSETDSLKSDNSVSSSRSSQQQPLYTFHPHATNHDRIEPTVPSDDEQHTCDPHTDGIQCENSVSSQTDATVHSGAPCDSDCAGASCVACRRCVDGDPPAVCQHHSPPVPPKPAWLQTGPHPGVHPGPHTGQTDLDGSPSRGGHMDNTELPECVSGYEEELPPPPVATYPSLYIRPDYSHGEPMYVPGGPQYVPIYQPVNAPCDCHLRYPRPHPASNPAPSHTDHRGNAPSTNPRSNHGQTGIMGCVHHHMNPAWHGHAYTLPYMSGGHIHNMSPVPTQATSRQNSPPAIVEQHSPQKSPRRDDT